MSGKKPIRSASDKLAGMQGGISRKIIEKTEKGEVKEVPLKIMEAFGIQKGEDAKRVGEVVIEILEWRVATAVIKVKYRR